MKFELNDHFQKWFPRFYDGPDWIHLSAKLLHKKKYRSPIIAFSLWTYGFYLRIFTRPARYIFLATLIAIVYTLVVLHSPTRAEAAILSSLICSAALIGWWFRPHVVLTRTMPERVGSLSKFKITYNVRNLSSRPLFDFEIDESIFPPFCTQYSNYTPPYLPDVAPHADSITSSIVQAPPRGIYNLPSPLAGSAFPLNLIRWTTRGFGSSSKPQKLIVHPSYHQLTAVSLQPPSRLQHEGTSIRSKVGETNDFSTCREFRHGDDPRHINWAASARTGNLIVKEFEDESIGRIALILDTQIPTPNSLNSRSKLFQPINKSPIVPEFEAALSLIASLSGHFSRQDLLVDLFAAGDKLFRLQTGRGIHSQTALLDLLSELSPVRFDPVAILTPELSRDLQALGAAAVILLDWNEPRAQMIRSLRESGLALMVILIENAQTPARTLEHWIIRLTSQDIINGKISQI